MAYRSEEEATRARRADLERELAEVRARSEEFAYLAWRCKEIEAAIAELDARAGELAAKKRLPMLPRMRMATPCKADWDQMAGDERVRFCTSCEKNVYNLSALTTAQAEALLREKEGNLCATYFLRADDTILTSDCSVGVRQKWIKRAGAAAVLVGGAVAGVAALVHRAEEQSIAPATADVQGFPPANGTTITSSQPVTGVLNPQTFADVPRAPGPVVEVAPAEQPVRRVVGGIRARHTIYD